MIYLSLDVAASDWDGDVNVVQPVYENITLIEARSIAIEKLKTKAAQSAGSYIVRTEKIVDNNYSENVDVVSASLVELSGVTESVAQVNNVTTLTLSAKAHVNGQELERRLKYISENELLRDFVAKQNEQIANVIKENGAVALSLIPNSTAEVDRTFSAYELDNLELSFAMKESLEQKKLYDESVGRFLSASHVDAAVVSLKKLSNDSDGNKIMLVRASVKLNLDADKFQVPDKLEGGRSIWIELVVNGVKFRRFLINQEGPMTGRLKNLSFDVASQSWICNFNVELTPYIYANRFNGAASENRDVKIIARLGVGDRRNAFMDSREKITGNGRTLTFGKTGESEKFYVDLTSFNQGDFLSVRDLAPAARSVFSGSL